MRTCVVRPLDSADIKRTPPHERALERILASRFQNCDAGDSRMLASAEVKIGELLGKPPGKGVGGGRGKLSPANDSLTPQQIVQFRKMAYPAKHRKAVYKAIEKGEWRRNQRLRVLEQFVNVRFLLAFCHLKAWDSSNFRDVRKDALAGHGHRPSDIFDGSGNQPAISHAGRSVEVLAAAVVVEEQSQIERNAAIGD